MRDESGPSDPAENLNRPLVVAALRVSVFSVAWTIITSVLAVLIGLHSHTAVLVAFGAVGFVDAIGSVALSYHFLHALRHSELSSELENLAHGVVLVGLLVVGSASALGGVIRLVSGSSNSSSDLGIALAAVSLVVLLVLSGIKRQVAGRVASSALRSDGHLSAVGATLAGVTLAGTGVERWFGWHWADATATILVGLIAIWLVVSTWRSEHSN